MTRGSVEDIAIQCKTQVTLCYFLIASVKNKNNQLIWNKNNNLYENNPYRNLTQRDITSKLACCKKSPKFHNLVNMAE